jgi:CHAT domain-containing protein
VAELMTVSELKVNCSTGAQLVAPFGYSIGASQVVSGDEGGGIAHQRLKPGAVCVLANFWKSDVAFIEQWSAHFLTNWLHKRQPKAIAWQQATRLVLKETPDLNPFLWGPISLLGDWL